MRKCRLDNPQEILTGLERQRIAITVRKRSLELPHLWRLPMWVYGGVNKNSI